MVFSLVVLLSNVMKDRYPSLLRWTEDHCSYPCPSQSVSYIILLSMNRIKTFSLFCHLLSTSRILVGMLMGLYIVWRLQASSISSKSPFLLGQKASLKLFVIHSHLIFISYAAAIINVQCTAQREDHFPVSSGVQCPRGIKCSPVGGWGPAPDATHVLGHRPVITWHLGTCNSQSYVCCLIAVLHDMQSIVVSSLLWRDSHSLSHMPTVANSSRAIIIGIPQVICHHNIKLHVLSVVSLVPCHLLSEDVSAIILNVVTS
jgi:hypothetical protein